MAVVEVTIDKLIHGGQALGTLADGKRALVWNALPGERVMVEVGRSRSKYVEGVAVEILQASKERIAPVDAAYLSTSPWQIMPFANENQYKQQILVEAFEREHVALDQTIVFEHGASEWRYRNKMEYSFWADETGLHLALYGRGSHGKQAVPGSSIAMPAIDEVANKMVAELERNGIRGSQLKTMMLRANQAGEVVVALFVKDKDFIEIPQLGDMCKGVTVCFSTPKSPASVLTKTLYTYGDITLLDTIADRPIRYDVHSFFQVNVPVLLQALTRMSAAVDGAEIVDFYSGVGTIGLGLGSSSVLVDSDVQNCEMALLNAADGGAKVIHAPAEKALGYIDADHVLVVDPPRAGLHPDVIERICEARPPKIVYLSCNPSTQARDIALLDDVYTIQEVTGYNFFPRTPHIESLVVLELKPNLTA